MVGLPARGKSTIATKLKENLMNNSVKTKVFNNGDLRRKMIPENTSYPDFFNPENKEAVALREKIARINMQRAKKFLNQDGQVAILDATNTSLSRRKKIISFLNDFPILFIECINEDKEILDASILRKIDLKEFGHLSQAEAIASFYQRIAYYQSQYLSLGKKEGFFIKLDSLHNKIISEDIDSSIPFHEQIRDFLVSDTVKSLFLIRHGETYFNLENRIGGDSDLTPKGWEQARALARFFQNKKIPLIFTSQKKRTIQTAFPLQESQPQSTIISLAEFNEIDAGVCECMTYEEIKNQMPEIYQARKKNKYHYIYPQGEGYLSMRDRINKGIKKALYLSNPNDNIMIIGHRGVNRMILSHFLFRRDEDVPFIYIPQDKFYYIAATQDKKLFQLKSFQ
jgi:broad specificity phosphatase PhoE/predicted kinase